MLSQLSISNLAVIERIQLSFDKGFHVLTGETGAGKSIVIDALSLIAGGRGSAGLVRSGCDKAEIEAAFDMPSEHPVWNLLESFGLIAERDEDIIIRREITAQGKSTSRINGQLVNLSMLKNIGDWLVNIHGQHEHQSLLHVEAHLPLLDQYGVHELSALKEEYRRIYEAYSNVAKERKRIMDASGQALQLADLYRFQAEEIAEAGLRTGEDAELTDEKRMLSNAEKRFEAAVEGYESLYGQNRALDYVTNALNELGNAVSYDPAISSIIEQMQSAYYQLEDAAFQLRDYRDQVEFNPERLNQIEERLDLIASFRRKYGSTVDEMLEYYGKIRSELEIIDSKDELLANLEREEQQRLLELAQAARQLSAARHAVAERLAERIETELRDLHMERTRFKVQIVTHEFDPEQSPTLPRGVTANGWDEVEFLISANPGEPLRPLHKIASGGEISRIMLALKTIFARMDRIPVLVFDEVDTGVSGRAAQAIAEKIAALSADCQVFSITHLPQVACMADAHYAITKVVDGERTYTNVQAVERKEREIELARLLSGVEITDTTLHHAREMLAMAERKKRKTTA